MAREELGARCCSRQEILRVGNLVIEWNGMWPPGRNGDGASPRKFDLLAVWLEVTGAFSRDTFSRGVGYESSL